MSRMITEIESSFGKMTVTRGRKHIFLGMNIEYTSQKTAIITMKEYLREAISESEMGTEQTPAPTPATKNLFEVDKKSPLLSNHEGEIFHSVATKLLYVAIRARMDLLLAVIFLCTRVAKCTEQDRRKLRRLLSTARIPSAPTTWENCARGLTHLTPYTLTSRVILVESCHSAVEASFVNRASRNSTPRARRRLNWWEPAIASPTSCG